MACIRQSFPFLHSHPTDLPTYLLATSTFHTQARKFGTFYYGGTQNDWTDLHTFAVQILSPVIPVHTNNFLKAPERHQNSHLMS